jgi:hypothetical protein
MISSEYFRIHDNAPTVSVDVSFGKKVGKAGGEISINYAALMANLGYDNDSSNLHIRVGRSGEGQFSAIHKFPEHSAVTIDVFREAVGTTAEWANRSLRNSFGDYLLGVKPDTRLLRLGRKAAALATPKNVIMALATDIYTLFRPSPEMIGTAALVTGAVIGGFALKKAAQRDLHANEGSPFLVANQIFSIDI